MTRIYKEILFDAAHYLPDAPEGHPNRRVHGHSFRVTLWLEGAVSPKTGLIRHFEEIDREIAPLREKIDHHVENILAQCRGVAHAGERVVVGHEVKGFVPLLQGEVLADRAEVVTDVKGTGRLDSRKNSHGRNALASTNLDVPAP